MRECQKSSLLCRRLRISLLCRPLRASSEKHSKRARGSPPTGNARHHANGQNASWRQGGASVASAPGSVALFVLVALVFACLAPSVYAQETTLRALVSYHNDGSVQLDDISVTLAGIDQQSDRPLPDGVQLVLDNKVVYTLPAPVTFHLLDAGVPMPTYSLTFRLPYIGNRGLLRVIRNNRTVLEFDLHQLCNNDGVCGRFENGISCPDDCDVRHSDNVCMPYQDGGCDPDCAVNLDPDCGPQMVTPLAPGTQPVSPVLPVYLLLGLAAALAIVYWWTSRR